jgi:hypothetical protein
MSVLQSACAIVMTLLIAGCSAVPEVAYDQDTKMLWVAVKKTF